MNKTKNIIGVLALVVVIVGGIAFAMKGSSTDTMPAVDSTTGGTTATDMPATTTGGTSTTGGATVSASYSLVEVAAHKNASSCWAAIDGSVYDLTSWIGKHPGGDKAILSLCGKDGSNTFNGQHGMDNRAKGMLMTFKLGALK